MSNNPFAKHTSNLFGSRGCDIDQALIYANEVISAMPGEVQAHATTALMVVVNTAANIFTQATGPSPEKQIAAAWVRELVAQEIEKQSLQTSAVETVIGWLSDNLDDRLDDWANNSMGFDDSVSVVIERWIENNLDVSSQVESALEEFDLSDKIESAINEMDLVVRTR
jgi:uncharacterized protein YejL (UPF0352 family)